MTREQRESIDRRNAEAWSLTLHDAGRALVIARSARDDAWAAGYDLGLAGALLNIGWCSAYLAQLDECSAVLHEALDIFSRIDDAEGQTKATNALGALYQNMSQYERAMDHYSQSIEIARHRGLPHREATALNNIGEICKELGNHKEALDYFLRANETMPETADGELQTNVLLNIGATFIAMGDFTLALDFVERALALAERLDEGMIAAQAWREIAKVDRASGQTVRAESRIRKALALAEQAGDQHHVIECLLDLGSLELELGRIDDALADFARTVDLAERSGARLLASRGYERISEVHERKGDFKMALDYYRRFTRYERELSTEDTTRKIKNIQMQYEIEKTQTEAEIYRLRTTELRGKTEQLEAANRRIATIAEIGRTITSSLVVSTVADTLYESVRPIVRADVFAVAVYEAATDTLRYVSWFEDGARVRRPARPLSPSRDYPSWCVSANETVFVPDTESPGAQPVLESNRKPTGRTVFCAPLSVEHKVIGVFVVQNREPQALTDDDRHFLVALTPFVAVAVANALIHDRVEELNQDLKRDKRALERAARKISHLANHDSLTGLPNRRLLFELLENSLHLAARQGTKVAVVYIDLDEFKPINDRFGHFTGDRALIEIANRLRGLLRESDTVARMGGDEFVAIVNGVHARDDVRLVVEKIIETCRTPFPFITEECCVSVSVGIAVFPDDGSSIEELVKCADGAMYGIKHSRKNGFAFAGQATSI